MSDGLVSRKSIMEGQYSAEFILSTPIAEFILLQFYANSTNLAHMPKKPDTIKEWLLDLIEDFLTINAMENDGCQFGWLVMQDRSLVQRLRDGGDVTTRKLEAILAFMQDPVTVIPRGSRKGELEQLDLKPLTIKRRELP